MTAHQPRPHTPAPESTIIHGCHRPNIHEECTHPMMCIRCEFWEERYPDHDAAIAHTATLATLDKLVKKCPNCKGCGSEKESSCDEPCPVWLEWHDAAIRQDSPLAEREKEGFIRMIVDINEESYDNSVMLSGLQEATKEEEFAKIRAMALVGEKVEIYIRKWKP